jgi:hypothetical protein
MSLGSGFSPIWWTPPAIATEVVDDTSVTVSATPSSVTVTWDEPSNGALMSVSGPGVHIEGQSRGGSITTQSPNPGSEIAYVFTSHAPLTVEDQRELEQSGATVSESDVGLYESIEIKSVEIVVPDIGFTDTAKAVTTMNQPDATSFRYTTFIPNDRIYDFTIYLCPVPIFSYFLGDNRTFDAASASFRTRVNVRIDWLAGGAVSYTKSAGLSTAFLYNATDTTGLYTYQKVTGNSNLSEVQVDPISQSSSQTVFDIDHNAVDPLCVNAVRENKGIEYHYTVTVQRSGNYGLSGWALRVPAHEAYIRDSYSPSWKTVFQRDIKAFDCLLDREAARCRSEFSYSGAVL